MALQSLEDPYVHSNYFLFSKQMRNYLFDVDEEKGISRMAEQIAALERIKDDLKREAHEFLGGDTPEEGYRKIIEGDTIMSRIGKEVVATPAAREALMKTSFTKEEVSNVLKSSQLEKIANAIVDELDINEIVKLVSEEIFKNGFGKMTRVQQIDKLKGLFNLNEASLNKILDNYIKGKLRKSSGKIQKIVREVFSESVKEQSGMDSTLIYNNFIRYFERAVRARAKSEKLISTQINIVDQYLERVKPKLARIIKQHYSSQEASGSLGEEIIANVNENQSMVMIAVGKKKESEIRQDKNLMPSLETATTWNGINKMSYSDMILINANGKTVRAQSKNYVEAYGTFLATKQDVYQSTHLFSRAMLFKEFFQKLLTESGGRVNIAGQINLDYLSYVVANEIWFDMHGSIDRGGGVGWREGQVHTRLFDSDSWLSRALSGAFVNFLGVVVSENGQVIPSVSNAFFLIDNKALVPTYELIDNVLKYYKDGVAQITNIDVVPSRTGIGFAYTSPQSFLKAKADAAEGGLGQATYTDAGLVGIGRQQGKQIMETLRIKSVNLGVSLERLLTSAWRFDT